MPDPLVVTMMRHWRQELLAREAAQMQDMAVEWLRIEQRMAADFSALAQEVYLLRLDGHPVDRATVYRLDRYRRMLAQMNQLITGEYLPYAERLITAAQLAAIRRAVDHATQAIQAAQAETGRLGASFNRLPVEAVASMAGFASDGSPLANLLGQAYPEAANAVTDALIDATARGINPRATAAAMAHAGGAGLQRSLVIARTEQLRAYRETARLAYEESGVVSGFYRLCAHDTRVCPACLAREGEFYPLSAGPLREHPQGRCTMVPQVKGLKPLTWQQGEAWFNTIPEEGQRAILGKGRYEAWRAGDLRFPDMAQTVPNATWGDSLRVAPLRDVIGA